MPSNTTHTDIDLINLVKKGDNAAFRQLFDRYYKYMVVTAYNVLGDGDKARDLAQDVFMEIWKKRETINISNAPKSYLRRAVVNKTLNYIKAQRLDFDKEEQLTSKVSKEADAQQLLEGEDIQQLINDTIATLPKKCQTIFILSRKEHLSHKEIAEKLNISTKTIENHMTKALKTLREAIETHLKMLILLIVSIF